MSEQILKNSFEQNYLYVIFECSNLNQDNCFKLIKLIFKLIKLMRQQIQKQAGKTISYHQNSMYQLPNANHVALMFFDVKSSKWKIAELSYLDGGKIIRDLDQSEINDIIEDELRYATKQKMQRFAAYNTGILVDKELLNDLNTFFCDKHCKESFCYSLIRYQFTDYVKLICNSDCKKSYGKLIWFVVCLLGILKWIWFCFSWLIDLFIKNGGYTCVSAVYHFLEIQKKKNCNNFSFTKQLPPVEWMLKMEKDRLEKLKLKNQGDAKIVVINLCVHVNINVTIEKYNILQKMRFFFRKKWLSKHKYL